MAIMKVLKRVEDIYKGDVSDYSIGDILYLPQLQKTYVVNTNHTLVEVSNSKYPYPAFTNPPPTNCPNCGAPLSENNYRCEYCGTPYRYPKRSIL